MFIKLTNFAAEYGFTVWYHKAMFISLISLIFRSATHFNVFQNERTIDTQCFYLKPKVTLRYLPFPGIVD